MSQLIAAAAMFLTLPAELPNSTEATVLKGQEVVVTLSDGSRLCGELRDLNDNGRVKLAVSAGSTVAVYAISNHQIKQIELKVAQPTETSKTMAQQAHQALFGN